MKTTLRVLAAIITAPIWVMGGFFALFIVVPYVAAQTLMSVLDFIIDGKWRCDWLQ